MAIFVSDLHLACDIRLRKMSIVCPVFSDNKMILIKLLFELISLSMNMFVDGSEQRNTE